MGPRDSFGGCNAGVAFLVPNKTGYNTHAWEYKSSAPL